ncbi:hypothetical protein DV515_00005447 [Chloebia gouldiae]|uniref:Uncharacterized protein n=1 Tax=Chloebia gouldiae TaxID=44316 RepID=A0A3L8SMR0_CHLGU|nr:hypothetical protein DV515_00005447 [Chloebia gouldiae]
MNPRRGSCRHFSLPGTALLCGEAGAGAPRAALAARALKVARSIRAARRPSPHRVQLPRRRHRWALRAHRRCPAPARLADMMAFRIPRSALGMTPDVAIHGL